MATNAKVGIELLLENEAQFRTASATLVKDLSEMFSGLSFAPLRASHKKTQEEIEADAKAAEEKREAREKAAAERKEAREKAAADRARAREEALAQKEAQRRSAEQSAETNKTQAIAAAHERLSKRRRELEAMDTHALQTELDRQQKAKQDLIDAIDHAEDAAMKRSLSREKTKVDRDITLLHKESLSRPEVQHEGAGMKNGIMGLGRNLLMGDGKSGDGLLSGVLESVEPLKGLLPGLGAAEGGIAAIGGTAMATATGVGAAAAALGFLFEKGEDVAKVSEDLAVGFKSAGLSGEKLDAAMEKAQDSAEKLGIKYNLDDEAISTFTATYLKFGGTTDNIAKKQELIIGLAERAGISHEAAAKALAKGTDPEIEAQLSKQGIVFKKGATEAERYAVIADKVGGTLEGLAEKAQSPAGQFEGFKLTIDNLIESLGTVIFDILSPLFTVLGALAKIIQDVVMPVVSFLGHILSAVVGTAFKLVAWWINTVIDVIIGLVSWLGRISGVTAFFTNLWHVLVEGVKDGVAWFTKTYETIRGMLKSMTDLLGITNQQTDAEDKQAAATEAATAALAKKNSEIDAARDALKKLHEEEKNGRDEKVQQYLDGIQDIDDKLAGRKRMADTENAASLRKLRDEYIAQYKIVAAEKKRIDKEQADIKKEAGDLDDSKKEAAPKLTQDDPAMAAEIKALIDRNKLEEEEHGQHTSVTLALFKERYVKLEEIAKNNGANQLAISEENYRRELAAAAGNAVAISTVEANHKAELKKLGTKAANDTIAAQTLLHNAIRDAEKRVEDQQYEEQKKSLEAQNLSEKEYKSQAAQIEVEHNLRLIEIFKGNTNEITKLEEANRKLRKQLNDDWYTDQISTLTATTAKKLQALSDEHVRLSTSEREFQDKQYQLQAQSAQASLTLARFMYGENSKAYEEAQKKLSDLTVAHNSALISRQAEDEKAMLAAKRELIDDDHEKEIQAEDDKYAEDLKKAAKNNELQQALTAAHNKRLVDLETKYWMDKNAVAKVGFGALNSFVDQGLGWLDERWAASNKNQETGAYKVSVAMLGIMKGFVTEYIQALEKKAIASVLADRVEETSHTASTGVIVANEGVKEGSFFATAASAVASAASTVASWAAAGAAMVAQSAVWIGKNLLAAASSMVSAVASVIAWLTATLGPFAIAAIPAAVAGLYGLYQGAKSLFGFKVGGYTGDGGEDEEAGVVHRKEYVIDAETVSRAGGPQYFDKLRAEFKRKPRAFKDGGYTGDGYTDTWNDKIFGAVDPSVFVMLPTVKRGKDGGGSNGAILNVDTIQPYGIGGGNRNGASASDHDIFIPFPHTRVTRGISASDLFGGLSGNQITGLAPRGSSAFDDSRIVGELAELRAAIATQRPTILIDQNQNILSQSQTSNLMQSRKF